MFDLLLLIFFLHRIHSKLSLQGVTISKTNKKYKPTGLGNQTTSSINDIDIWICIPKYFHWSSFRFATTSQFPFWRWESPAGIVLAVLVRKTSFIEFTAQTRACKANLRNCRKSKTSTQKWVLSYAPKVLLNFWPHWQREWTIHTIWCLIFTTISPSTLLLTDSHLHWSWLACFSVQ